MCAAPCVQGSAPESGCQLGDTWGPQQICSPCLCACLGYPASLGLKLGESYLSCAWLCIGVFFTVEWFPVSCLV